MAFVSFVVLFQFFIAETDIQIKVTDTPIRELLVVGVDRRIGGKMVSKPDSWEDVKAIMVLWSKKARYRLCQFREASDCVSPGE